MVSAQHNIHRLIYNDVITFTNRKGKWLTNNNHSCYTMLLCSTPASAEKNNLISTSYLTVLILSSCDWISSSETDRKKRLLLPENSHQSMIKNTQLN